MAKAIIHFEGLMREKDCSFTIRWEHTKGWKETRSPTPIRWTRTMYLREAILAHLTRKAAEARTRASKDWVPRYVKAERRCRPRGGRKKYKKTSGKRTRESPVDIPSSLPATRQSASNGLRQSGLTNVGCAAAENASRDTTCLSSAGSGGPKSRGCGTASGRPVNGNTRERQPSGCSLSTRERRQPFCTSCGTRRPEE